ncbi:MAG: hypothetical protein IIB40_11635 [Candidatus Marinimicrobia bacterium]|nr:hypothetical protein [Candidatus Neomarinimicrobiota bacterium]
MNEKILGDILHQSSERVFRGYQQYRLLNDKLGRWLRIAVYINNKIDEEDVLGVTGVTLFMNAKSIPDKAYKKIGEVFKSIMFEGSLNPRLDEMQKDSLEFYLRLRDPYMISAPPDTQQYEEEITSWLEQFLSDDGTLEQIITWIDSENIDVAVKGEEFSESWGQSMGKRREK